MLANLEKASSTLRAFIDAETLEELLGKTVKRRAGWAIKPGKAGASFANRYRRPIDLRVPAPKDGRPRNAAGASSFHFDHEAVKKTKANFATRSATNRNPASAFEAYASNPSKVAQVTVEIAERYLASAKGSEMREEMVSRVAMMASNIGDSVEEREAFWVAAWAASNTPGLPIIELRSGAGSIAEWRALGADATTPKLVAEMAEQVVRERLAVWPSPVDEAVVRIPLVDPEAIAWAGAVGRKFGKRREDRIVHYVKPRSGVVQLKLVAEIPHELHSEDRCAIITAVAADLDALGVHYTIVAHAPDDNNDRRNQHLHILIHPGSCVRAADGNWDFRRGRRLRPGDIAAKLKFDTDSYPAGAFFDLAALDIAALRRRYAEHCNDRLERRGAIRRLDPRSYAEMGIAQQPQKHLGTTKAAMVAAGALVEDDRENMIKSLKPEFERLDIADRSERRRHAEFLDRVEAVGAIRVTDEVDHLAALMADYRTASEAACELSLRLARLDLEKELAWSGAERLRKKTLSLLKAISAGTASPADARNAPYIDARYRLALEHHQEIHAALRPWYPSIDAARLKLENDQARLAELEVEINAVIERERFAKAHDESSRWRATTVLLPSRYPTPLAPHAHVAALIGQMQNQAKADGPIDPDRMIFAVRKPVIPPSIDTQGLGGADTALVSRDPFRRRFEAALEDVCKHQELAIGRVLKFIAGHGEEALAITAGREGDEAHRSLIRWHRVYRDHPVFQAGLDAARHEHRAALERARDVAEFDGIEAAPSTTEVASAPVTRENPALITAAEPIAERALDSARTGTPEITSVEARFDVPVVREAPIRDAAADVEAASPLAENPTPARPVPIATEVVVGEGKLPDPPPGISQVETKIAEGSPGDSTSSPERSARVFDTFGVEPTSSTPPTRTSPIPSPMIGSVKAPKQLHEDRIRMLREGLAGRRDKANDEVNSREAAVEQTAASNPEQEPAAARPIRSESARRDHQADRGSAPIDPVVQVRNAARADIRYQRMSRSERQSFEEYMDEITGYFRKDSIRLFSMSNHLVPDRQTAVLTIVGGAVASELGFDTVRAIAATFDWREPPLLAFDRAIVRSGAALELSEDKLRIGWDAYRNKRGTTGRG